MDLKSNICETALTVFTNPNLSIVLSLVFVLNLIAIALSIVVIVGISAAKTIHIHLRILFVHLTLVLLFRTCCTTYRSLTMLLNYALAEDSCDLIYSLVRCKTFSEISKSGLDVMMYCFIPIALERLIATIIYSKYERIRCRIICVIFGILLPWIPAIIDFYLTFTSLPEDEYMPYCSSLSSKAHDFFHLTFISLPLAGFCVTVCFVSIYWSLRKRRFYDSRNAQNGLSGIYQLVENIRTTKLIVPSVFAYSVALTVHIAALSYVSHAQYSTVAEFAVAKEWTSFILPVFANFFPLTFILGSNDVAKRILSPRLFHRFTRPTRIAPLGTTTDYFDQYDARWR